MVSYDGDKTHQQIDKWKVWVLGCWFVEWLLLFLFTRFACWKARCGEAAWASWVLLPAYETAIMMKKAGLLLWLISFGFVPDRISSTTDSVKMALGTTAIGFGSWLYAFTYGTVLYVMCSQSAGTIAFYRAISLTVLMSLVSAIISYFELACVKNEQIVDLQLRHNSSVSQWPSFGGHGPSSLNTAVPGIKNVAAGGQKTLWAASDFWTATIALTLGIICMILLCTNQWRPRQPWLAAGLLSMFVSLQYLSYFSHWESVGEFFSFNPLILFGVLECPLKYYVMLLESRVT